MLEFKGDWLRYGPEYWQWIRVPIIIKKAEVRGPDIHIWGAGDQVTRYIIKDYSDPHRGRIEEQPERRSDKNV